MKNADMKKLNIEVGAKFGRWIVAQESQPVRMPSGEPKRAFHCVCECGNEKDVPLAALRSGKSKSCGCHNLETRTSHGMSRTPIYGIWSSMIARCTNEKSTHYADYGGRGITVCERWLKFENFYADVGDRPQGYTLDRKDNNLGYEPSNFRWATRKQQQRNTRFNRILTINGESKCASEWSEILGIPLSTLRLRHTKKESS